MRRNLTKLNAELRPYGVTVDTYSPGDGVTRYRFFSLTDHRGTDYFAGDGIYTALGFKEAATFAEGWKRGMEHAYKSVGYHTSTDASGGVGH